MKNPFHVMLIPTLGCPSKCSYCWSSEEGSPVMSIETIRDVVAWLKNFREDRVTFTFHGGEPLLAGPEFYRQALPLLSQELHHLNPEVCHADKSLEDDSGNCPNPGRVPCSHRFEY